MSRLNLTPLRLFTKSSAPGSPVQGDTYYDTALGYALMYNGSAWQPGCSIETYTFGYPGTVALATGASTIQLEGAYTLLSARAYVTTAPTGASLIALLRKNGSTTSATMTVAATTNTAVDNTASTFAITDKLTVNVTQVGSTIAGADLTVTVRLLRTG